MVSILRVMRSSGAVAEPDTKPSDVAQKLEELKQRFRGKASVELASDLALHGFETLVCASEPAIW